MKRTFLFVVAALAGLTASAQYYPDAVNKDMLHIAHPRTPQRKEIVVPNVDGYTAYKADLHTHTLYSDGSVLMGTRLREAWYEGIDVMAVTEHLEYRPHEKELVQYLSKYMPAGTEAKANSFVSRNRPASRDEIMVDLNFPVEIAKKEAQAWGITIIPGIEITRKEEGWYSHFNALFTTDNNTIYDPSAIVSIRNAKAQNALVLHNHPGWRHVDMKLTDFEKKVYKENLIDGIEVMNGAEFYPKAITRAQKYNFFVSANTDVHANAVERYEMTGSHRNMTLIFAKDKSLASIREALEAHRTLAYSFGVLAGEEELLRKVFEGSVKVQGFFTDAKGNLSAILTNSSTIDWLISRDGKNRELLKGQSSIMISFSKSEPNIFTVHNAWCGEDKFLTYEFK